MKQFVYKWSAAAVGAGVALGLGTGAALAQNVGIGTTKGGATAQVSTAIAKVVSAGSALTMRPQPYANTAQYIPRVNSGQIEFGVANVSQAWFAVNGKGMSEGRPNPNLRMVAVLFPFRISYYVPAKLGISKTSELKGKRMPGFANTALGQFIANATLNNGGLAASDVTFVRVPNFPRMWAAMKSGTTDAAIAAIGSKPTYDMAASVGGVVALSYDADPAKIALMRKYMPQSYVTTVKANPKLPGLQKDVQAFAFDYVMFANKSVSDDVVYKTVKALYDGEKDLQASSPLWRPFKNAGMGKNVDISFHPGAVKFYKEKGIWPGK